VSRRLIGLTLLLAALISSALGVVYAKYASRKLFLELQVVRAERDAVDVEWGRLQLEQSTWAAVGRVERVASKRLDMREPSVEDLLVIEP
jgi:cell division protein FtsL